MSCGEGGCSGAAQLTSLMPLNSVPPPCPLVAAGSWERRSGEEVGAHGYWYRWTEVRGCDETGAVQARLEPGGALGWWGCFGLGHALPAVPRTLCFTAPAAAHLARLPPSLLLAALPSRSCPLQWYEKWWEVSDWKGMKEMGAEKWGCNERGEFRLGRRRLAVSCSVPACGACGVRPLRASSRRPALHNTLASLCRRRVAGDVARGDRVR